MGMGPYWGEEAEARLLDLWRATPDKAAIAATLGRTSNAIGNKLNELRRKLGDDAVPLRNRKPRRRVPFSDAETEIVLDGYATGKTVAAMLARLPGRDHDALHDHVRKLRREGRIGHLRAPGMRADTDGPLTDGEAAQQRRRDRRAADALGAALQASGLRCADARNARTGLGGARPLTLAPSMATLGGIGSAML